MLHLKETDVKPGMEKHKRPLTPEEDALEHISAGKDKSSLEERFIDAFKGRGLFTRRAIQPSSFVVEYRGNVVCQKDAQPVRSSGDNVNNFLYEFSWNEKRWCVDASIEDGSLGRLGNDDHQSPNCKMKKISFEGKPHLCLFALRKISAGEEITYNYGNYSYPWRSVFKESCFDEKDMDQLSDGVNSECSGKRRSGRSRGSISHSYKESQSSSDPQSGDDVSSASGEEYAPPEDDDEVEEEKEEPVCGQAVEKTLSKKNYCFVCGKGMIKLARHLRQTHAKHDPEVAAAFKMPKNSKEQKLVLKKLRCRGNVKHNEEVLRSNRGQLKLLTRPRRHTFDIGQYVACLHCKAMVNGTHLWSHLAICPFRKSCSHLKGVKDVSTRGAVAKSQGKAVVTRYAWKVLSKMKQDNIAFIVHNDDLLVQLAQYLSEKCNYQTTGQDDIVDTLRVLGKLMLALQAKSIFKYEDAINPNNFHMVLEVIRYLANFDKQKRRYRKPVLASRIGSALQNLCKLVLKISHDNEELRSRTTEVMAMCKSEFRRPSAPKATPITRRDLPEKGCPKEDGPCPITFTMDVQVLHKYLEKTLDSAVESLEKFASPQVYNALCRVLFAQVSILNKGSNHISKLTLKSFHDRKETEQVLSKQLIRIDTVTHGKKILPVLLKPEMISTITLLVDKRSSCGVHADNPYLFAKPDNSVSSAFLSRGCVVTYAKMCHVKQPDHLKGPNFRHLARLFHILDLNDSELDHLAKVLGRNMRTERDWYRTPEAAQDLAKVAKLLMAMEMGFLEKIKGDTLDQVQLLDHLESYVEEDRSNNSNEQDRMKFQQEVVTKQGNTEEVDTSENDDAEAAAAAAAAAASEDEPAVDSDDLAHGVNVSDEEPSASGPDPDQSVQQENSVDHVYDGTSDEEDRIISFTKENFCFVCGKGYSKIIRHFWTHRKQVAEIQDVYDLRPGSKKRRKSLELFRNRGNFQHNLEVLKKGGGKVRVMKRTSGLTTSAETLAACLYCKAMFPSRALRSHFNKCLSKKALKSSVFLSSSVLQLITTVPRVLEKMPSHVENILRNMKEDEIGSVVLSDRWLLLLAKTLRLKDACHIRARLRAAAELLLKLKEKSVETFDEALRPGNFSKVLEAAKELAHFNEETKFSEIPGLMSTLAYALRKMAELKYASAVWEEAHAEELREAETFMKLVSTEKAFSRERRVDNLPSVPFTQDAQLLHQHLEKVMASEVERLQTSESQRSYSSLLKVLLAQVLIFNTSTRKVSRITLQSFVAEEHDKEDVDGRPQLEQFLAKHRLQIKTKARCGQKGQEEEVTLTLTPDILDAVKVLVSKRDISSVSKKNPFLFATPDAPLTFDRGHPPIRSYLECCGAKSPQNLRMKGFYKHVVRIFLILSLRSEELEELSKLLDQDFPKDREYYRTPEAAVDIVKISELLSAAENGCMDKFHGKSFEDMEVPDQLQVDPQPEDSDHSDVWEDSEDEEGSRNDASWPSQTTRDNSENSSEDGDTSEDEATKPPEKTLSCGSEKSNMFSSGEDEDMNVDFDMDIDTDEDDGSRETKNVSAETSEKKEEEEKNTPGRGEDVEEEQGSTEKKNTDTDQEEAMDVDDDDDDEGREEHHVKAVEDKRSPEKEGDKPVVGEDRPPTVSLHAATKRKLLLELMKEVRISLPKLNIENLNAPVPVSQFLSARTKTPAHGQPTLKTTEDNRRQTPSRSTDVQNKTPATEKTLSMTCSQCRRLILKGQTAFQKKGFPEVFCSKTCLFAMFALNKPEAKTCHHCHKVITLVLDLVMAAVDPQGTMKNFCNVSCLCSFKSISFSPSTSSSSSSSSSPPSMCSMCNQPCTATRDLTLSTGIRKFCSDSCLEGFQRDVAHVCDVCGQGCDKPQFLLKLEDRTKAVCKRGCLEVFKEKNPGPRPCTMCCTPWPTAEMFLFRNTEGWFQFFCSRACVNSYKQHRPGAAPDVTKSSLEKGENKLKLDCEEVILPPPCTKPTIAAPSLRTTVLCSNCGKKLERGRAMYRPHDSPKIFCSQTCFSRRSRTGVEAKTCFNCCQVIPRPHSVILAPVGDSGTMKELCSETCLASITSVRSNKAPKPPTPAPSPSPGTNSSCRICHKLADEKFKLTVGTSLYSLCSEACYVLCLRGNNLPVSTCRVCGSVCVQDRMMVVVTEEDDDRKTVCSDECLVKFKEKTERLQSCPTCCTSHRMSDMIENKNRESVLSFYCSDRCMMVYMAQSVTLSERGSPSPEGGDIEDVKPTSIRLDCIKKEPDDEEFTPSNSPFTSTDRIKPEPTAKEDGFVSVVSMKEDSTAEHQVSPVQETASPVKDPCSTAPPVPGVEVQLCCCDCKKVLVDGETFYQKENHSEIFCSVSCLFKFYQMKPVRKTCFYCLESVKESEDVLQAPVDDEGTVKDFCGQTCMSSFNYKKSVTIGIPMVPVRSHSQCCMCNRYCISRHEVTHQERVQKLCSDSCFLRFCNVNHLSLCGWCHRSYVTAAVVLRTEELHRKLCSAECVAQVKKEIQTPQQCSMCSTSKPLSDMVENRGGGGELEFFCSLSCVTASKIQAVSAAGSPVDCASCGKNTVPACHLAMADASIRNFCSLSCAMAFKEKQPANDKKDPQKDTDTVLDRTRQQQLLCVHCQAQIEAKPKVVQKEDRLSFLCSQSCCVAFRRDNNITGRCEYCQSERVIYEVRRMNGRDCCFCSEGCEMIFTKDRLKEWGSCCHTCHYCSDLCRTSVTSVYGNQQMEFCSEDCRSKFSLVFNRVAQCDSCGQNEKLKESLQLPAEVKHFCDLRCLQNFCRKAAHTENTVSSSSSSVSVASCPVISNVISLAGYLAKYKEAKAKIVGQASVLTDTRQLKNKSLLCTPLVHNKGVSCTSSVSEVEAQTDTFYPKVVVLPVPLPLPVYLPLPMSMYSQFTPYPVALPLPLPVPMFVPVLPDASKQTEKKDVDKELQQNDRQEETEGQIPEAMTDLINSLNSQDRRPVDTQDMSLTDPGLSSPVGLDSSPAAPTPHDLQQQQSTTSTHRPLTCDRLDTERGVQAWRRWVQWRGGQSDLHTDPCGSTLCLKDNLLHCSLSELSLSLSRFVSEWRRVDGDGFSPDALFYVCLSLQKFLFDHGRMENIFSDLTYSSFSTEFTNILRPSVRSGALVESCVKEDFLWDCKQLGAYSPLVLLNTLLFFCCKHFGFTGVEHQRQLRFTNITSCTRTNPDQSKTDVLRFYPLLSRESDGVPAKRRKKEEKQIFLEIPENEENSLRCPVRLFEFYLSKCPRGVRQSSHLFYLHPERRCVPSSPLWFSSSPLDDRTMEAMLVRIMVIRELQPGTGPGP